MALDSIVDRPRFSLGRRKPIPLADHARDTRQWEAAAQLYHEALQRNPYDAPIWVQYGHALKEAGDLRDPDKLAQAEAAYRRAVSLDPGIADSHLQLGHVLKLQGKTEEARGAYLRALAIDSSLDSAIFELVELGWTEAHFSELRIALDADLSRALAASGLDSESSDHSIVPSAPEQSVGQGQEDVTSHHSPENTSAVTEDISVIIDSSPLEAVEREAELILRSGLFDSAWYRKNNADVDGIAEELVLHYLYHGAYEGRDPHPLFDSDWYLSTNPDVAKTGVNPLVHYLRSGGAAGRAPHPLFDAAWYLKTNPDVAATGLDPLGHYLRHGGAEGRAPNPQFSSVVYLSRNPEIVESGINPLLHYVLTRSPAGAGPATGRLRVPVPDLFELRALKPQARIAVVLHLYDPGLWNEMREGIERISPPFDLFVSIVKGSSEHLRPSIMEAFPRAYVFDFEDHGRDIGSFLVFLQSGVLFRYDLICKLHTKRSPHRPDGDAWRRALIDGVLGTPDLINRIISNFRSDPDLGMVVAEGNIYRGHSEWASNEKWLTELLPRMGISPDVKDRSFPGGSIFWIRPLLLRTLAGAHISIDDFDPEPLKLDGSLGHAVERMFGLICEDAGMRVAEHSRLVEAVPEPSTASSKVHVITHYLPQFHPVAENDTWWGPGFTEWTNVAQAKPLFHGHCQPRLPSDLGFYDLRLPEAREAQANLARQYGVTAFCYYYYWFNGRRILERPLDEVLGSGKPEFPFLICWANEPWTRNWDGLNHDILLQQAYEPGWMKRFAHDVAPLLRDQRYFRLNGSPMLLIYRIGHIPDARAAMRELRAALFEEGISEVHLAAAWICFPEDDEMLPDPALFGLDSYYDFPPHWASSQPLRPLPPDLGEEFVGKLHDYNRTVTAALAKLSEPLDGLRHRSVMVGWDSTARKGSRADIFHRATPTSFRRWLRGTVKHERRQSGDRVIFINAWNEWAEGAYLEPDRDFGCGWLEAVASATRG